MSLKSFFAAAAFFVFLLPGAALAKNIDLPEVRGVSLPSFEWACVQYDAVYDFPLHKTVAMLENWNLDTVRLPLNQDCWLDSQKYRSAVDEVIVRFGEAGFGVIIDLHWNAPAGASGIEQQVMADAESSPKFWRQIAQQYRDYEQVIAYELYNEPHTVSWDCWLNGCVTDEGWRTVGMQELVNTVREYDSNTWVIVNGLNWANNVIGAIEHSPVDPANKLAFGWHIYDEFDDPEKCVTQDCFAAEIAPLAKQHSIVITEFGSRLLCNPDHDEMIMNFASQNAIGLVAWAWYPADCGFPSLIKDWSGTPTEAGSRWCNFLNGDCYGGGQFVAGGTANEPVSVPTQQVTPTVAVDVPLCLVSFQHGVLNDKNTLCTEGYTVQVSGVADQTWNNRISSWQTDGDWLTIAGWDYYTTSGRIEKGIEVWTPNSSANVAANVNDKVHYILMFPKTKGSLTVYENINLDGPFLELSVSTTN